MLLLASPLEACNREYGRRQLVETQVEQEDDNRHDDVVVGADFRIDEELCANLL